MKLATVQCQNPSCRTLYEAALEDGEFFAKCPVCAQNNRVAGQAMGKEITGRCDRCGRAIDDLHLFGRQGFCCPPESAFRRSF